MKKKKADNYLEKVPVINKEWRINKKGFVEVVVENKGFFHSVAQKFFKKPRFSYIALDEYGSCIWQQIDGQKNLEEIGRILSANHEKAGYQLYERLSVFFGILERNGYIKWQSK